MPHHIAPGEGERRAVGGYIAQYRVSASIILRHLHDGTLSWIRVADPLAERVDDLQIGTQSRVDAYQVKWSTEPDTLTFDALLRPAAGDGPCLIRQLASGWTHLRQLYPGSRVVVHLISDDIASPNRPRGGRAASAPGSLATFLRDIWALAKAPASSSGFIVPDAWQAISAKLREASAIPDEQFGEFVRDCEIELGYRLPRRADPGSREADLLIADLAHLTSTLFATVADPAHIIELDTRALLARLGWSMRVDYRSRHEFPVDEVLYTPIESSVQRLDEALHTVDSGYIAVLGTPGSGKSSLLTHTLRSHAHVVRYYAYVPESRDPLAVRAEAESFLHDMTLALQRAGISAGQTINSHDIAELASRFRQQMSILHERWLAEGIKTILVVDGLDHITREMRPQRPLLDVLPLPEEIPPGVIMILGSQTVEPFPPRVRAHLQGDRQRLIDMDLLPRSAIHEIIRRASLATKMDAAQQERVVALSAGHPLALVYLIQQLRDARSSTDVASVLDTTEEFRGNIEDQYATYWEILANDRPVRELLAYFARLRGAVDLKWVQGWPDADALQTLVTKFGHYFRREGSNWSFFHNSFRVFLERKTAEFPPGEVDPDRDRRYHRTLADLCAQAPPDTRQHWDALYHLVRAEEYAECLRLGTQAWFRGQLFAFRPATAIGEDIRLLIRHAIPAGRDIMALTRLILIGTEMADRASYLERAPVSELLAGIGDVHVAAACARSGTTLLIRAEDALAISRQLADAETGEEARRIFELAEPLDLLAADEELDPFRRDEWEILDDWAAAAPFFRSTSDLIETITRLRFKPSQLRDKRTGDETYGLHNRLLFEVGRTLLHMGRLEEIVRIAEVLSDSGERYRFWLYLHAVIARHNLHDNEGIRRFLDLLTASYDPSALDPSERTALAEAVLRIDGDAARAASLIARLPQPPLAQYTTGEHGMQPFMQRLRLTRIRSALGEEVSPALLVPDATAPEHQGLVYFERAVCTLGQIWGAAWRGQRRTGESIVSDMLPALRLFNRRDAFGDMSTRLIATAARSEFFEDIVRAAKEHGPEAVVTVRDAFEREWTDAETREHWPYEVRRAVLLALHDAGIDRRWIGQRLEAIEATMLDDESMYRRVDACMEQARAWLSLGDTAAARRLLGRAIDVSFSIGPEKDYQLGNWIDWMPAINELDPDAAASRIAWFARAVVATKRITDDGSPAKSAANRLLAATFHWSPRSAVRLLGWLAEKEVLWHAEALLALLTEVGKGSASLAPLALDVLEALVLPIALDGNDELIDQLLRQYADLQGIGAAQDRARRLLDGIATSAPSSTRQQWRHGVAHAASRLGIESSSIELNPEDLTATREGASSSDVLKFRDGTNLAVDEVNARISSVDDLETLRAAEASDSRFKWEPVVRRIAASADRGEIARMRALFRDWHYAASIDAALAERLCALGDSAAAWSLAIEALRMPNEYARYGWDWYHDGGRRIACCRALLAIDADRARPVILDTLVGDLAGEAWFPRAFAMEMDEILLLLTSDVPIAAIWAEIEQYLHSLFATAPMDAAEIAAISASADDDSGGRALADLILVHMRHPISLLAHAGMRIACDRLLAGDVAMGAAARDGLAGDEMSQERLLMVLDAVSARSPQRVASLATAVARLGDSPNFMIRAMARKICALLGYTATEPRARNLPGGYRLVLPPQVGRIVADRGEPPAAAAISDSDDPVEVVSAFRMHLHAIADRADLSHVAVSYRAAQIMREIAPYETWSETGEKQLREKLYAAHLRITYTRPQAEIAKRAMFHVVAELADSGALTTRDLRALSPLLRCYDADAIPMRPARRPMVVVPMLEPGERWRADPDWIRATGDALALAARATEDGRIVLAEMSEIEQPRRPAAQEKRMSVVTTSAVMVSPRRDGEGLFGKIFNGLIAEYPMAEAGDSSDAVVVRNSAYWHDSPYQDWLAFDPSLARELGWRPGSGGLFRWEDEAGHLMVETVLWSDGVEIHERESGEEIGRGWLVLASSAALDQLRFFFPTLIRVIMVERSYHGHADDLKGRRLVREIIGTR